MKHIIRKCADSRLGDHRKYSDVGDKVLIPNLRKGTIARNVSLFKRIPDTVARGSADIDHVEEQSDLTPVPVPHHAGEHQALVDAPTVTPVTIVQSTQCEYRL